VRIGAYQYSDGNFSKNPAPKEHYLLSFCPGERQFAGGREDHFQPVSQHLGYAFRNSITTGFGILGIRAIAVVLSSFNNLPDWKKDLMALITPTNNTPGPFEE